MQGAGSVCGTTLFARPRPTTAWLGSGHDHFCCRCCPSKSRWGKASTRSPAGLTHPPHLEACINHMASSGSTDGCSSPRSHRSCPPAVPGGLVLPTLNSLQLPCKQGILHPHFPKRETEAPRQQLTPLLLYLANAGVQPVRPGRRFFSASLFRKLRCLRTLHPLI